MDEIQLQELGITMNTQYPLLATRLRRLQCFGSRPRCLGQDLGSNQFIALTLWGHLPPSSLRFFAIYWKNVRRPIPETSPHLQTFWRMSLWKCFFSKNLVLPPLRALYKNDFLALAEIILDDIAFSIFGTPINNPQMKCWYQNRVKRVRGLKDREGKQTTAHL